MNKNEMVTVILLILGTILFQQAMSGAFHILLALFALFSLIWAASVYLHNSSIVDIIWGPAFAVSAILYLAQTHTLENSVNSRGLLVTLLVSAWATRLGMHIFFRFKSKLNTKDAEDKRYQEFRKNGGDNYWLTSLMKIFLLQAWMCWVISSTLWGGIENHGRSLFWLDYLGITVFILGFSIESIADTQLKEFKSNATNKGQLLTNGLWAWCRHPNYFGEALLWWGFYLIAVANGEWSIFIGPLLITFLLMRVSGVTLLETTLKSKPGFEKYQAETPAFFPKPPQKR